MTIRPLLVRSACLTAIAISVYYLTWRLLDTLNPHAMALSIALYAAECYGLVTFLTHVLLVWDTRSLERRLGLGPEQTIAEAVLPPATPRTIDVFIPTYNESVALLRRTALASRDLRGSHRTWVLDDGHREEVREMCEELGVGYLTRASNEHAKAGNLNAALQRTDGELVVVLDADFIALPHLLERTLPYFEDEGLAFVQLPQAFYNVDSVQHVAGASDLRTAWHEQSMFYEVIQPGKNRWNSAFWCGSPAVLRRQALESVGGAATSTVTEDILTSMRMHAAGWRSLYHNEVLAVGVAPGDLDGFRTQRLRWAQGSMQILRSRENPLIKRALSLPQRVSYFTSMSTYFQSLQLAVFVTMPLVILLTGQTPIKNLGVGFFARFAPYVASLLIATKLTGGPHQRPGWDLYFSFLRMFIFLRALATLVTGGGRLRFRVTPKAPSASTQRRGLYPHLAVAAVNLVVIAMMLVVPLRTGLDSVTTIVVCISAAAIVSVYGVAVLRLWRRIYRRHDFRVSVALAASVAADGVPEAIAHTQDLSFGGVALSCPQPLQPGAEVTIRLLADDAVSIPGTVMTCREAGPGAYRAGVSFAPLASALEKRLLMIILKATIDSDLDRTAEPAVGAPSPIAVGRTA